ncbi:MAG: rod shape-determining protein RodA [Candidatus Omnitrophica bacterium]|nr:rod shape-determining protein RodA [Candidatus Omnitrophota bacterium]MDD5429703.1 rod shape-determining protein RodA [Candidatus Omnitrophota bacterium]
MKNYINLKKIRSVLNGLSGLKTVIFCLLALNLISLSAIYSSLHQAGEFIGQEIIFKQIIWMLISWVALAVFSFINYRIYFNISYFLYTFNILLLIVVYFFGKSAMGAQRWLSIFGFTFQPSELSKVAVIIVLARIFSFTQNKGFLKGFLFPLVITAINALIIFKQPDLGTALVLIFLFLLIGFFSKVPKVYFITFILICSAFSPLAFNALKDYQKKRLLVFINPDADPLGSGYTIIQSKIAIGSGKFFGKGFLSGTQNQFNFLPERHTDFIFTVIAEEWGLAGSIFLIMIYWLILSKILQLAKKIQDPFGYFLCLGISALLFSHVFINIGMTLGVLPVVGIPLIFLSYGGTSLLISYILMGIFLNVYKR